MNDTLAILGATMAYLIAKNPNKFTSLGAAALIVLPVNLVDFGTHLIMGAKYASVWLNLTEWRNWVPILMQLLLVWLLCLWAKHLKNGQTITAVLALGSLLVLFFSNSLFNRAIGQLIYK